MGAGLVLCKCSVLSFFFSSFHKKKRREKAEARKLPGRRKRRAEEAGETGSIEKETLLYVSLSTVAA